MELNDQLKSIKTESHITTQPLKETKLKIKAALRLKAKKKFLCDICQKTLSSEAHYLKHVKTHNPKDFICDFDGKHFNTKDKLRLHIFQHRIYFSVSCTVCGKEYKTNQSMRKHLRTHFENHQCSTCGRTFKHKRLLLNHISAIHQDDPTVPCKFCTRLFPNKTTRDAHQKSIHRDQQVNTTFFKCTECPLGFEMKEELRIHSFIHFEGVIHTCLDCNQIFKKKKLLHNHMKKHEVASFRCNVCKQLFKYRSNLGKHKKGGRCKGPVVEIIKTEQSPEEQAEIAKQQLIDMTVNPTRVVISNVKDYDLKSVKKEIDEDSFDDDFDNDVYYDEDVEVKLEKEPKPSINYVHQKRLYRRKNAVVPATRPSGDYKCDLCDFKAVKKCKMLSHIRQHVAINRHKCVNCSETFPTKVKLHNHSMKRHGRGVIGSVEYSKTSSQCTICNRTFSDCRLKYHMKLHESPNFFCDKCGKTYRNQSALEKHFESSHLNEKKFTCATCGKSFKKLTILKQHEETHNPIKIYVQCQVCSSVMQIKSLKLHMEVKHGDRYKEKSHVCECGKAFRYSKQLEKHCESVHKKVSRGIVYHCPDCDLSFNRRHELREHSFVHFPGKVFDCECGMKFKKQKLLTIHSAVHKSDQWPCDLCNLVFQTRGGRRKHLAKVHGNGVEEVVEIPPYETLDQ